MAGQASNTDFALDDKAFRAGLERALAQMEINTARELNQLGQDVRNRAARYTPVKTGLLRNGWHVTSGREYNGPSVEIANRIEYAFFVEFGTRPHAINVKTKKVLANKKTGEVFGKYVFHPGTEAQPMLRPAILEGILAWNPKITP